MIGVALLLLAGQPGPLNLEEWSTDHCPRDKTTADLLDCASGRARRIETVLNAEWAAVARDLKQADRIARKSKSGPSDLFDTALAAQRAWLTYRQAQCSAETKRFGNGSFAPVAGLICTYNLTRERAVELRDMRRP